MGRIFHSRPPPSLYIVYFQGLSFSFEVFVFVIASCYPCLRYYILLADTLPHLLVSLESGMTIKKSIKMSDDDDH